MVNRKKDLEDALNSNVENIESEKDKSIDKKKKTSIKKSPSIKKSTQKNTEKTKDLKTNSDSIKEDLNSKKKTKSNSKKTEKETKEIKEDSKIKDLKEKTEKEDIKKRVIKKKSVDKKIVEEKDAISKNKKIKDDESSLTVSKKLEVKKEDSFKKSVVNKSDSNLNNDIKEKEQIDEKRKKFIYGSLKNRKKHRLEKRKIAEEKSKLDDSDSNQNIIKISEALTVNFLSEELKVPGSEIIKKLMSMGVLATLNQKLDFDTAVLIADEYGYELEFSDMDEELVQEEDDILGEENLEIRPPVITVMGHVDHGKTSLLDAIRKTNVVSGEAGGITQHIGAYQVATSKGLLTFLDTPGHAAFTAMRARGVQVTDIVIIVVAANDSVMPQTIEAINHAKAASIPIIVAINKIDLPDANIDRVMQDLSGHGLLAEDWGGDTIMVKVSARTKEGLEELLEMLALQAEILEIKSTKKGKAKGTIVEAKLDKKRGPIATVLVQKGTLRKGDVFICGTVFGKVREAIDDKGRRLKEIFPSMPVEILGFNGVPEAGDSFIVINDEKEARKIIEKRKEVLREERLSRRKLVTLEDLNSRMQNGEEKELNVIIKADVRGSIEALKDSLERLSNKEIKLNVIHTGAGIVNESDIMLATASNAIIILFNLELPNMIQSIAEKEGVEIRTYKIIYEAIDEIKSAMEGLLDPTINRELVGKIEIRQVINIPKIGLIAGSMVIEGEVNRNNIVKIIRDKKEIFEGRIDALKRFKDNVEKVDKGYECGVSVVDFSDYQIGDIIEAYIEKKVLRKL
jgi:translation initiation factor IF-2